MIFCWILGLNDIFFRMAPFFHCSLYMKKKNIKSVLLTIIMFLVNAVSKMYQKKEIDKSEFSGESHNPLRLERQFYNS